MTNTFSMNEAEADAPVLNADEQESLAIGEEMQAADDQLLAGKYKSVQDLEKGYLEAQKMLGDRSAEEETVEEEPSESSPTDYLNAAASEYGENGELSEETMNQLTSMSSEELIAAYIDSQTNQPQGQGVALSDRQVQSIKQTVGGDEQYDALVGWAGENLDSSSIDAFDSLVESGNAKAIELAVAGLNAMYEAQNGSDGQMITGKAPSTSGDRFRSQQEVVAAMTDPRYDNDPAYRQEIIEKLDRSDNFF
tara:strand:- start:1529 stop:2281 length:753 start_codon:yes stop_codon:yes gene_type:complete